MSLRSVTRMVLRVAPEPTALVPPSRIQSEDVDPELERRFQKSWRSNRAAPVAFVGLAWGRNDATNLHKPVLYQLS